MPLFTTIKPNKNTRIIVWKIEEDISFFKAIYINENSNLRISNMKSEIHQKGFLSVRYSLAELGYTDDDLFYTQDGKPHLKDGKRISITHSFEFSAIIVSNQIVGIDIEKNREKIITIAPKFIGRESKFIKNYSIKPKDAKTSSALVRKLTIVWGAKESLYKIHPDGGLLFKHHLHIEKFKSNDDKTRGWIKKDNYYEVYNIFFKQLDGYTLVYALN